MPRHPSLPVSNEVAIGKRVVLGRSGTVPTAKNQRQPEVFACDRASDRAASRRPARGTQTD
eukprot:7338890-Pyramimonas_sp.AAC.1